jgi:hypothetical protein
VRCLGLRDKLATLPNVKVAVSQYPPPQFRTPKQKSEDRAYLWRVIFWIAMVPPVLFLLMVVGYSDQAPARLREFTAQLDASTGRPVWSVIAPGSK